MRLTKEQLIAAAHAAAKYLPAASADIMKELATRLDVTSVALSESMEQRKALAVDNNFLLGMAARELSTSWLHNRAMLGMQAALLCLSQGDIKAAREWLEGTTDEAVAEMPDDMTPDGLQLWYDSYMQSSDGKNGFLTYEESLYELSKRLPASTTGIGALREEGINFAASRLAAAYNHGFVDKPMGEVGDIVRMILDAKNDLANSSLQPVDGLSGEYAEQALKDWKVLEQDRAVAAAAGKTKITKKLIAPEVSVKSARRLVELISLAGIDDNGVVTLEGLALAEVLAIVDEHKAILAQREKTA